MAEEKIIQLIEIQTDTSSLNTLKQEIKLAKDEMEKLANGLSAAEQNAADIGKKFGTSSIEFKKASAEVEKFQNSLVASAKNVAVLKDRMDDVNDQINSFHPDKKFQGLALSAQIGATALQGVAGSMAFLGVESETAMQTMAKLQGLMAFTQALKDVKGLTGEWEAFKRTIGAAKTATEGQTKATQGATVASKSLGVAMKAMGIGLIIAAVAYLVTNWDKLRNSVVKLIPALGNIGGLFNQVKAFAMGLGNVVLKFVIGPIEALVALVSDGTDAMMASLKKNYNLAANFEEGHNSSTEADRDKRHKENLGKQIKRNQDNIDVAKAAGRDTYQMEMENFQKRKELAKGNAEEMATIAQEELLFTTAHNTKLSDQRQASYDKSAAQREQYNQKMAELLKSEREKLEQHEKEIKQVTDDAVREVALSKLTDKEKEIDQLEFNFNKQKEVVEKLYTEDKNILDRQLKAKQISLAQYNSEIAKLNEKDAAAKVALEEKKGVDELTITQKYSQMVTDYLDQYQVSEFERRKMQVISEFDELLNIANEQEAKAILIAKEKAVKSLDDQVAARKLTVTTETDYINTTVDNMPVNGDSVEDLLVKNDEIYTAMRAQKDAQFQADLLKLAGDEDAIANLKAKYRQQEILDQEQHANNEQAIKDARLAAQMDFANAVGGAIDAIGNMFKKNTAAAKVAALAEIAINTGIGFMNALKIAQQSAAATGPGAAFAMPIFYATQVAAVLGAVSKAKAILQKVPGDSGGGSSIDTNAPQIAQAPQINASNLNVQPTQDVRVTNQQEMLVKAYIPPSELKRHEDEVNFFNKLGNW